MVEHGDLGRDRGWMAVRHVDRAAAELDASGVVRQARDEDQGGGDALGEVGNVLADEGLDISQLLRQQDRVAILLQGLGIIARRRMKRHGEIAELHGRPVSSRRLWLITGALRLFYHLISSGVNRAAAAASGKPSGPPDQAYRLSLRHRTFFC